VAPPGFERETEIVVARALTSVATEADFWFYYWCNLHEQVKNAFCYRKLFWTFTFWKNCSKDGFKFFKENYIAAFFFFLKATMWKLFLWIKKIWFYYWCNLQEQVKKAFCYQKLFLTAKLLPFFSKDNKWKVYISLRKKAFDLINSELSLMYV
jgi:hypothetical protein